MDNILGSIKQLIGGFDADETDFDDEILIHINSVFAKLTHLGVGDLQDGFQVDKDTLWETYFNTVQDKSTIAMLRTYVYAQVRLIFDPPTGSLLQTLKDISDEFEWRLNICQDSTEEVEVS